MSFRPKPTGGQRRGGGGGGGGGGVTKDLTPERRAKTLFVGNLDKRVTERHLIELFSQFGSLHRIQFMWHHHGELRGQPRGFAFVEFEDLVPAQQACARVNGVEIGQRKLVVRFAEDDSGSNEDALQVEYQTTGERRKQQVDARMRAVESGAGGRGGRGGGRGGFNNGMNDRFAYVPSAIPSSGFSANTSSDPRIAALEKIRAIDNKLHEIQEEQNYERKQAARGSLDVGKVGSSTSSMHGGRDEMKQQPSTSASSSSAWQQPVNPDLKNHVHPSRRGAGERRSRSRSRSRDRGER